MGGIKHQKWVVYGIAIPTLAVLALALPFTCRSPQEGRTGYPFIEALMRQLKQTGFMHHLGRHAVACFLTRGQCLRTPGFVRRKAWCWVTRGESTLGDLHQTERHVERQSEQNPKYGAINCNFIFSTIVKHDIANIAIYSILDW